jgi:hypothetical protein
MSEIKLLAQKELVTLKVKVVKRDMRFTHNFSVSKYRICFKNQYLWSSHTVINRKD